MPHVSYDSLAKGHSVQTAYARGEFTGPIAASALRAWLHPCDENEPAPRLVGRLASAPEQPKPIDVSGGEHAGIDRASRRRLVQGTLEIGARLDLHGMTAAQAERSLARFIDSASTAHHRCVLVITGKGREGQGVLRRLVPQWLKTPPLSGRILAISKATQADGGEGALYVMLRRPRNTS